LLILLKFTSSHECCDTQAADGADQKADDESGHDCSPVAFAMADLAVPMISFMSLWRLPFCSLTIDKHNSRASSKSGAAAIRRAFSSLSHRSALTTATSWDSEVLTSWSA
jgi:hypothetical protein